MALARAVSSAALDSSFAAAASSLAVRSGEGSDRHRCVCAGAGRDAQQSECEGAQEGLAGEACEGCGEWRVPREDRRCSRHEPRLRQRGLHVQHVPRRGRKEVRAQRYVRNALLQA